MKFLNFLSRLQTFETFEMFDLFKILLDLYVNMFISESKKINTR